MVEVVVADPSGAAPSPGATDLFEATVVAGDPAAAAAAGDPTHRGRTGTPTGEAAIGTGNGGRLHIGISSHQASAVVGCRLHHQGSLLMGNQVGGLLLRPTRVLGSCKTNGFFAVGM